MGSRRALPTWSCGSFIIPLDYDWHLPAGDGCAWCAGEAATTATIRRVLVDEKGHDRHAIRAAAYRKRGAAGHHENLDG